MSDSNFFPKNLMTKDPVRPIYINIIVIFVIIIWLFLYIKDISSVPFHPDESTQIFMSKDVDLIISGHFNDLIYNSAYLMESEQRYRLLDSPVTRYIIGLARQITNSPSLFVDWDWSKSWFENQPALPGPKLLFVSRFSIAILLPFTLLMYYILSKDIFGKPVALLSSFLLMTNSLILLHVRRSMAEGALIFFIILGLFLLLQLPKKILFLSAIPIVLAINSKQSAFPLILIGIIYIIYLTRKDLKLVFKQVILYCLIAILLFFILNPVLWGNPHTVLNNMFLERNKLTTDQINSVSIENPDFILNNANLKLIGIFGQLFVVKPAIEDISNYENNLISAKTNYLNNILYGGLGRNLFIGSLYFIFFCFGLVSELKSKEFKKYFIILTFLFFFLEILFFISIPFQRYYIILVPFSILFLSCGLINTFYFLKNAIFHMKSDNG